MHTGRRIRKHTNSPRQEVSQMHKLAVVRVFHIYYTPTVLPSSHGCTVDNDVAFRANDGEGDDGLFSGFRSVEIQVPKDRNTYPDGLIEVNFLVVIFICIKGVKTNVVVHQLFPNLHVITNCSEPKLKPNTGDTVELSTHTLFLKFSLSSIVNVSDFAMTGTTLTTSLSFFITITSMGRSECPVGLIKYKQQ